MKLVAAMAADEETATRLINACTAGDLASIKDVLGETGTEDRLERPLDGLSRQLIHFAARAGQHALCTWILEQNAQLVDVTDVQGRTPLHHAASGGSMEVAALLVALGAEVDAADKQGLTPLDVAEGIAGAEELVEWLREQVALLPPSARAGDLLEMYSGFAANTVAVAPFFRKALSIEIQTELARVARRNLAANGCRNAQVLRGDCAAACRHLVGETGETAIDGQGQGGPGSGSV